MKKKIYLVSTLDCGRF